MITINTNNKIVQIEMVIPNEYNPKLDYRKNEKNKAEFEKIKQSLVRHGQVDPILVREISDGRYEIVNGFHRYEAMKELGMAEIEVKNLGEISFDKAVAYALSTEEIKVPIDSVELSKLMRRLVTDEKGVEYWSELLPYDSEFIQCKKDLLDFDYSQFDTGEEEPVSTSFNYTFKFNSEVEMDMVKDYFSKFDKKGKALVGLL